MKIISDKSLICFLHDLRRLLVNFQSHMPEYIHFINTESLYFYMKLGFPQKSQELESLMDIIDPYIPLIISPKNLQEAMTTYEQGNIDRLSALTESYANRSKFIFISSVMKTQNADWESMVAICRQIRKLKLTRQLNFMQ